MLFKLLDEVVARINALDPERDREALLPQLETIKFMLGEMSAAGAPADVVREVGLVLAGSALDTVKTIPGIQGDRIGVMFPGGGGVVADGRSVFAL